MEQEENAKTFAEYLEILNRRKKVLLITFVTVSFLGFVLAMKLPAMYRSSATILIEDQQIPRTMVETTITDFADKRIELIKQRVMTRDRILSIIQKHKLYLDERDKLVPSELVKRFQEDAEIKLIAADIVDPQRGAGKATIAFTISFSDRNPTLAQAVANELVSLFLEENTRVRAQRAAKTTEFLSDEAEKLRKEIEQIETQLATYKAEHGKSLPEMLQTNITAMERATESLRDTDNNIRLTRDRINLLTESLRQAEEDVPAPQPNKPLSKDEQLRALKSQYLQVSSRYTPNHPDVQRLKTQILNLDPSFTGDVTELDARQELTQAQNALARLTEKYSENHPDVVKQRQRVAALEQKVKDAATQESSPPTSTHPESLLFVNLSGQLQSAQHELEHLLKRREELQKTVQELQSAIDQTPLVEKEYLDLLRARQTSLNKYADLEAKHREAKLAQTLEEEQKGETFTLIDPPAEPDKPEKPDRKKIVLMGLGLGVGTGLGLTVLLELLQEVIRGPKALERVIGMQPIVVIPYIETPTDWALRKRRVLLTWVGGAATSLAVIVFTHFFVMPLDQLWARALIKLARL